MNFLFLAQTLKAVVRPPLPAGSSGHPGLHCLAVISVMGGDPFFGALLCDASRHSLHGTRMHLPRPYGDFVALHAHLPQNPPPLFARKRPHQTAHLFRFPGLGRHVSPNVRSLPKAVPFPPFSCCRVRRFCCDQTGPFPGIPIYPPEGWQSLPDSGRGSLTDLKRNVRASDGFFSKVDIVLRN